MLILGQYLLIGGFVYFIPTIIAYHKHKGNKAAITTLNVFLGWTVVGWVVALVWAMTVEPKEASPSMRESPRHGGEAGVPDAAISSISPEMKRRWNLFDSSPATSPSAAGSGSPVVGGATAAEGRGGVREGMKEYEAVRNSGRRPCPHCAELIMPAAEVCPFCKLEVPKAQ
jgi:hypothetical protein